MVNVERKQAAQKALRELGIPAVAGAVAAGAGIVLRRKPDARSLVPDVKGGVGDLVDDLRGKVQAVVHKAETIRSNGGRDGESARSSTPQDPRNELTERRRARERRRNERRSQSGR